MILSQVKGRKFRQDFKCLGVENRSPRLRALHILSLPAYSLSTHLQGAWGSSQGATCSLHLHTNHRTHLSSPPKTMTGGTSPAFSKCGCIICLHACDLRFYVKCPLTQILGLSPDMTISLDEANLNLPLLWGFPQLTG